MIAFPSLSGVRRLEVSWRRLRATFLAVIEAQNEIRQERES